MSTQNANGAAPSHKDGPATSKNPAASSTPLVRDQATATVGIVVAFGTRYVAAGESLYDWVVVRRCPLCGFGHKHLLLGEHRTITSFERSPACAKHRKYTVTVTDVVPTPNARRQAA